MRRFEKIVAAERFLKCWQKLENDQGCDVKQDEFDAWVIHCQNATAQALELFLARAMFFDCGHEDGWKRGEF